jgi:hypothetical protein
MSVKSKDIYQNEGKVRHALNSQVLALQRTSSHLWFHVDEDGTRYLTPLGALSEKPCVLPCWIRQLGEGSKEGRVKLVPSLAQLHHHTGRR